MFLKCSAVGGGISRSFCVQASCALWKLRFGIFCENNDNFADNSTINYAKQTFRKAPHLCLFLYYTCTHGHAIKDTKFVLYSFVSVLLLLVSDRGSNIGAVFVFCGDKTCLNWALIIGSVLMRFIYGFVLALAVTSIRCFATNIDETAKEFIHFLLENKSEEDGFIYTAPIRTV